MATSAKVVKGMSKMIGDTRIQLAQVQDERDRLAEFAKYVLERIWVGDDLEAADCQTKALELDLVIESEATEEDGDKYWYAEPGLSWYRLQPWLEKIEPVSGY